MWSFASVALLGHGGQKRPGERLWNLFGTGERSVEELWRRQRVGMEQARLDGWGCGDDGQHSPFFLCFWQMMERNLSTAATSLESAVGVLSSEAASRPMALCTLSRGTPF